jgi:prepilin-type N-terminal cleavage/methylation domain-containing protein
MYFVTMLTRLSCRTARNSSRGGFTLVELLVVIGIIAILAGVALGPITNGIKKAKQSSGLQSAHALGLAMYSAANDNNQLYPDKTGGSATAADIAATLLSGGYVSDATIFYLSGDTAATKMDSTHNTASTITQAYVCWDFLANGGNGVSSTAYPWLPIVWSTIAGATAPTFTTAAGSPITVTPVAANPFGTAGLAVFYVNNAAAFVTATGTTGICNMVSSASNLNPTTGGVPTTYALASGK